jgi:hypothetical protein
MKKVTIILTFASLIFNSCGNSNSSTKEKELEIRELELKQKEEILLSEKKRELELKELELKSTGNNGNLPNLQQSTNKKFIAIIQDKDGYTNVRNGMSMNSKIIDRIYLGEQFEVFPSTDDNWWLVYTPSNIKGYVHNSRIKIIN